MTVKQQVMYHHRPGNTSQLPLFSKVIRNLLLQSRICNSSNNCGVPFACHCTLSVRSYHCTVLMWSSQNTHGFVIEWTGYCDLSRVDKACHGVWVAVRSSRQGWKNREWLHLHGPLSRIWSLRIWGSRIAITLLEAHPIDDGHTTLQETN